MVTFLSVEFARSFIACAYGIHSIGLWFVIWGISSSVFSIIIGHVVKYIRKTNMLLIVVVLKCTSIIYLFYWSVGSPVYIIVLLAVLFGCLDTIYGTCINGKNNYFKNFKHFDFFFYKAIIGDVFHEKLSSAYAANRFCMSLFFLIAFSLSEILCVYQKMYIILTLGLISIISLTIFKIKVGKAFKNV